MCQILTDADYQRWARRNKWKRPSLRTIRKYKLKARYSGRIDEEIERTKERLELLEEIKLGH
jgi:hypothetical protein